MKKFIFLLFFAKTIFVAHAQTSDIYFMTDPTLSPNGDFIVFSYEEDLWKVNTEGGTAYRLTAMDGKESLPHISPDGKWIAFSGTQDNNANVYVMSMEGGAIKQLTFHESDDFVDSWSWDSKNIYFTSNRYNNFSEYKITLSGGTPLRLFDEYVNRAHHVIEDPVSKAYYFTESTESFRNYQRKRYKGDNNPDIEYYNPQNKEFKILTKYKGKDMWPCIDRNGNLFYASDEVNGEYNLCTLKNDNPQTLTTFETSIRRPQISANGEKIVFEKDYQLFVYNIADGKSNKINISLNRNNILELNQILSTVDKITYFDVSPDTKKLAFVSRGVLFVSSIDGKFIKQMETAADEAVQEVKWCADNATLIYSQTVKGWPNWFTIKADDNKPFKQLTNDLMSNRLISLNKTRTKGVYLSGRNNVNIIDLKTFKTETVLQDELWGYQNSLPMFSPTDEYIVFVSRRNNEQDIFVHNLKTKQTINITSTDVSEAEPFWSPDGKYIYFIANRAHPGYPQGIIDSKLYRLPLQRFDEEYKSDKYTNLFIKDKDCKKDTIQHPIIIDANQLLFRWEELKVDGGAQSNPYVITNPDETTVLFNSTNNGDKFNLFKMILKPFEQPLTEKIDCGPFDDENLFVQSQKQYYVLGNGNIYELKLASNKMEKIKIDFSFHKTAEDEFKQMFYETWTILKENFYDEAFHGINWDKQKIQYERFLPYLNSRDNLRVLLNDMLGELNASHLGFRTNGTDEKTNFGMKTLSTGIVFENENPYKVKYIIKNSTLDNINDSIKPGDILIAVNNVDVDQNLNREFYFRTPSLSDEIYMIFKRNNKNFIIKAHPQSYKSQETLLYDEWIEKNQEYIDKESNKRIAYVQMKDMSGSSLEKFFIEMTSEASQRDALILDLRYNQGGNVHDDVLNFLAQKPYLQWKYREGKIAPQPNFSPASKPIILLVNQESLSDAEITAAGFKELKLGKIIGTETYRWIIFTSRKNLIDGSYCRVPSMGCYTLKGDDLEKTGVQPDIYVKTTFPDLVNGKDPQLERAVKEILQDLKK